MTSSAAGQHIVSVPVVLVSRSTEVTFVVRPTVLVLPNFHLSAVCQKEKRLERIMNVRT